ncbi:MAG TPA: DUF58 domain-containing protein [Phycisphaerae bacterium]|nr:DUF58 domain-containing protein [Phycisphaerae bacterium]HSA25599.1 DUF58 domain-containing protein [Phycisphaerae bacterium]
MLQSELLKKVRRIEIRTSHMVNDVLAGQYHSAFKGRGMEFEEVRDYQYGDDVRTIDWNVSARYGRPFVKVFREERELTVLLLVDMSASHGFGTREQLKRDLVAEIGATLAFSAIRNNDKIGLMCFTDEVEKTVPARKGARHVLRVVRELLYHRPRRSGTDLGAALEHLNRTVKRRAVVFVVSDFQTGSYEDAMRVARRRHDVIPIVISDPWEQKMEDIGLVQWTDAETGQVVLVDTSSRRVRRQYEEDICRMTEERDALLRRMKIDAIEARTGEPFVEPLTRFFRKRETRR